MTVSRPLRRSLLLALILAGFTAARPAVAATPTTVDLSVPVSEDPGLGANPAFLEVGAGITPVDCVLPAWGNDPAMLDAFYRSAIACHDAAWRDTFTHFGLELWPAGLWAGAEAATYDGACAEYVMGREAFYCNLDATIVMPFDSMASITEFGPGYALAVVSHEYGHHIQEQFGIMSAYIDRRQAVGWESEEGLLLSRQLELQAWCLSGMFYGTSTGRASMAQEFSDQAYDNNSHAGDRPGELREHGSNENAGKWFAWGRHPSIDPAATVAPSLYECNPWAARDAGWLE